MFRNGTLIKLKADHEVRYPRYVGMEVVVVGSEHNEGDTLLGRVKVKLPDGRERWVSGKHFEPV